MAGSAGHHSLDMRMKLEFPVWYRSFAKSYNAWASAPSDLKTPLLLQGPALAKAEGWLLAAPERLSESQKRFIVRSIAQRARGGGSSADSPSGVAKRKRWQWKRSSDRSLWHLYAVIALGLWMFSPDIVRDLMEQSLNPPDVYQDMRKKEAAGQPPSRDSEPAVAGLPADALPQPEAAAKTEASAQPETAEAAVEDAPPVELVAPPPPITAPPPPAIRAQRLVELTRQQLAAGQSRTALLIGIEAAEAALEAEEAGREAASAVTALLTSALVTREQTAAIAARSVTERTAQFCNEHTLLTLTGDNTFDVWRTGSSRRTASQSLPGTSLDGVGLDRECSRALIPNLDFNVEVRSLSAGRTTTLLHGHEAPITAATFSPDGTAIVTASKDGTARIWDAASGRMRHLLSGHDWHVTAAAFSPDGRRVLTAASDMTARIWDGATGREIMRLDHQGVVSSAVFSNDGARIITTSWDGFARIWDARTGKTLHTLGQSGGLRAAEASRDGRLVATSASDGGLALWDAETGKALRTLSTVDVKQMVFTPDSRRLVALSWNNGLEIYDVGAGTVAARLAGAEQKVATVTLAQSGRALTGVTEAGTLLVWPLIGDASEAIAQAKAIAPSCLSRDERATLGMEGDPPAWCAQIRPRDAALPTISGAGER